MLKILKIVVPLVVVVVVGVMVGLMVTGGKEEPAPPPPPPVVTEEIPPPKVNLPKRTALAKRPITTKRSRPSERPALTSAGDTNTPPPVPTLPAPEAEAVAGVSNAPATPVDAGLITNWEDRVDGILGSDKQESEKVNQLLAVFSRLPEDGQVEVAQHLSNLVPDENYGALGSFVTNSGLPESVLDVLLSDALNRPNSVKLPLLLDVARDPRNPKAGEAKDILELYLDQDYGNDWAAWKAKTDQWLRDNPD